MNQEITNLNKIQPTSDITDKIQSLLSEIVRKIRKSDIELTQVSSVVEYLWRQT